jgi:membrane protein DedA with SNARE-associated domain/rhodanese-related sulfurtransferase
MDLLSLLDHWGLALVFGWVLVEQSGIPFPAPPLLVTAGAIAQEGALRPEMVLVAAVAASLIADHAWFIAGRFRGRALLAGICRLSLSPDTCVRRTDDLIGRHGAPLLIFAKFIPGVSAVAIPTAAAMGLSYGRFVVFDAVGALLWAGAYVGAGMIFSREVQRVLDAVAAVGGWALAIVAAAFGLYLAMKVLYRVRLKRLYRLVRVSPQEIVDLLRDDPDLLFVDARSRLAREEDSRQLPRAIDYRDGDVTAILPRESHSRTIVTFCTCPNEASAAFLADQLIRAGYSRVRVLTGGADALTVLAGERSPVSTA